MASATGADREHCDRVRHRIRAASVAGRRRTAVHGEARRPKGFDSGRQASTVANHIRCCPDGRARRTPVAACGPPMAVTTCSWRTGTSGTRRGPGAVTADRPSHAADVRTTPFLRPDAKPRRQAPVRNRRSAQGPTDARRSDIETAHRVPRRHVGRVGGVSPDGGRVAYTAYPESTLWRSRLDGSERQQLTFPPVGCPPAAMVTGRIADRVLRGPRREPLRIYVVPAAGGAPRRVTTGTTTETDPCWSADGRQLVFEQGAEGMDTPQTAIERVDLATGRVTPLAGSEGCFSPRWSPDGQSIVAIRSTPIGW